MSIRIITDSPSDIPLEEAKKLNIEIVPLKINVEEESYREGIDITNDVFYDKLIRSETLPTTSAPSPGDYVELFDSAKEAGDDVIVITLASSLSATYQSACIAKDMAKYERVFIIDSKQATLGQLLLVKYAVKLKNEGKATEEIVDIIEDVKNKVVLLAMVDTLDYLHKGGRLPKTVALTTGFLNIKPIIKLENGSLKLAGGSRGTKGANKNIIKSIDSYGGINLDVPAVFGYTGNSSEDIEKGRSFMARVDEEYSLNKSEFYQIGSVIGTHAGPGAFGIAFLKK